MDEKYLKWVADRIIKDVENGNIVSWLGFLKENHEEMIKRVKVELVTLTLEGADHLGSACQNGTDEEAKVVISHILSHFAQEWETLK